MDVPRPQSGNVEACAEAAGGPSRRHVPALMGAGAFVVAIVVLLAGWAILQGRMEAQRAAEVVTANLTRTLADNLGSAIGRIDLELQSVADEMLRQKLAGGWKAETVDPVLARHDARNPDLVGFRLYGPDGKLLFAVSNVASRSSDNSAQEDFKVLRDHADSGLVVTAPLFGPTVRKWAIRMGRRVTGPDGSFLGVVYTAIPVDTLVADFASLELGSKGTAALFHANLRTAARFPPSPVPQDPAGPVTLPGPLRDAIASGAASARLDYVSSVDHVHRTGSLRRIAGQPYWVLIGLAQDDYLAGWRQFSTRVAAFGGVAVGLVMLGLVVLDRRIRERQAAARALAEAKRAAEAASLAKSEFVANMSHEIRTPMTAVMGLARLLEEAPLGERERDYVEKIKRSAQTLLGILNDILDFSKIEAGRLELEQVPFSLEEILRNIAVVASTNARDKGVETIFSIAPDVPAGLVGDPLRLEQVLLNLTGNAVKFTERGEVMLSVSRVGEDEAGMVLEFAVRDTGIGIPVERQAGLFAAFTQADNSTSRKYGGTGLGLVISNRLVALMGGALSFTSRPGLGSDFRFTARFGRAPEGTVAVPACIGLENLTVLVVDDNDTAREVLGRTCRSFHWSVEMAESGTAGLERLRRLTAEGRDVDVLLLDWQMPQMDGVEMLRAARADGAIRMPPAILMVTAFGADGAARAGQGLAVDAVLAKPATPSSVFDAVARVIGGRHEPDRQATSSSLASSRASSLAGRLAGVRVLLVEDNEINQQVARDLLARAGAAVEIAGDGRTAVALLRLRPDRCDVVLMDVQMPGIDGYEATRVIRAGLGLAALPIVAMTANAMESDRREALAAGMNAHVAKPIDVDQLIATLTSQLAGRKAAAPPPPAPPPPPREPAVADLPQRLPGLDVRGALIRLGGDQALLLSLLVQFEPNQGGAAAEVRAHLAQGEREEAARGLHRLRGVAANLGAVDVARLTSAAEAAVKDGRDGEVPALLSDLEAAMAVVFGSARDLVRSAAPALASPAERGPLRDGLCRLQSLLHAADLEAEQEFAQLRPALAAAFGPAAAERLDRCFAALDFAAAEEAVREFLAQMGGAQMGGAQMGGRT